MMVYSRSPEPSQIEQSVSLGQPGRRDVVIVQLIAVRGRNHHTTPTPRRTTILRLSGPDKFFIEATMDSISDITGRLSALTARISLEI
jgi:hypothetical protein